MPQLTVIQGPDKGLSFALEAEVTSLGRNPDNMIVLNDMSASRHHAEIHQRNGNFYIRDLGSSHGTFLNDVRVSHEMLLGNQETLKIGNTELVFHVAALDPKKMPQQSSVELRDSDGGETVSQVAVDATMAFSKTGAPAGRDNERAFEQLRTVYRVAEAISSVLDQEALLSKIMEMIFEVFKPDRGVIMLFEGESRELKPMVARHAGAESELSISGTIVTEAIEKKMSLLITDTHADERFNVAQSVLLNNILSAICCPLVCKNKVLGALYIDSVKNFMTYSKGDLELMNSIAAQAAIAIENALLVKAKLEAERVAAIGVAVAGISHYVKNILAGIKGSAGLIDHGLNSDNWELVKSSWPILKRSNGKISELVQDMLTYSKKREPDWEPGNVNAMLMEIYEQQLVRANELHVALENELDEKMPVTYYDHQALHDTVLNLVGNAIEACEERENATVWISSTYNRKDNRVEIRVQDTGAGIPAEIQQKIFEPFFSTKGSRGTGLGLAVAKKNIEEHRGSLKLHSIVGQGTTFELFLPRLTESELAAISEVTKY